MRSFHLPEEEPVGVRVQPATPERWTDLEAVFGANGACAGCWCMFWRQTGPEFRAAAGDPNRLALRALVEEGPPPGLLAYRGGEPAGWCAVGPRSDYGRIGRSTALRPADPEDPGTWSVTCFYVRPRHRRQGLASTLLHGAVEFARAAGARRVEAYPVSTGGVRRTSTDLYTGTTELFAAAGFTLTRTPATGRRVVMSLPL